MGLVSGGTLRIQSRVAPVLVEECEGTAPNFERNESFAISRRHGIYEQIRNGKIYHLKLRADIGAGQETKFVTNDTIVFLDAEDDWKLFAGKKAQLYYYLIAQAGSVERVIVKVISKSSRTMGLLIRESPVKEGYWERVCLLTPPGSWDNWCFVAEDREIHLI